MTSTVPGGAGTSNAVRFSLVVTEGAFGGGELFSRSLLATGLGVACAVLLFPGHAGLVGVVLAGFGQAGTVNALLDRNRDEVWGEDCSSRTANWRLARSLMAIFLGVFAAYVVAVQLAPESRLEGWFGEQLGDFVGGSVRDIDFGTFGSLMARNAVVLVGSFLFALVYQHAGMLLVLAWNASRWGVVFSFVASGGELLPTLAAILPHLVLEASAYVLAAMSGVFLSRGLRRHALGSDTFYQVGMAVLRILGVAVLLLCLAGGVEAFITPRLVELLFGA